MENKQEYLTIKEACNKYGKHPDTIRSIIRKHPEATMKNEAGRVLIQTSLLNDIYGSIDNGTQEEQEKPQDNSKLMEILFNELAEKNKQIDELQKSLNKLTEQQNQLISQQQQITALQLKLIGGGEEEGTGTKQEEAGQKRHFWNRKK